VRIFRNTDRRGWLGRTGGVAALVAAMLAGPARAQTAQAGLPAAQDLAGDGRTARERGVPIVILFSLPGCAYCEVVRRHYLAPLMNEGPAGRRPLVRELDMSSAAPLRGFQGEAGSGRALARQYEVRVAPSVLVLDGEGKRLAPLLEGGDVAGMYGAYLDDRLAVARRALAERH